MYFWFSDVSANNPLRVTLWEINIAIENGHRNSGFSNNKMVIFQFANGGIVYQMVNPIEIHSTMIFRRSSHGLPDEMVNQVRGATFTGLAAVSDVSVGTPPSMKNL